MSAHFASMISNGAEALYAPGADAPSLLPVLLDAWRLAIALQTGSQNLKH